MVSSPNLPQTDNPVRSALEDVNERIKKARTELQEAERTIKRCTSEIDKWSAVANQLIQANRIAEQALEERTRLLKPPAADIEPTEHKRSRVPPGFWQETLPVLAAGGVDREKLIALMKDKARPIAPNISDAAIFSALWASQHETNVLIEVDGLFYPVSATEPAKEDAHGC